MVILEVLNADTLRHIPEDSNRKALWKIEIKTSQAIMKQFSEVSRQFLLPSKHKLQCISYLIYL